MLTGRVRLYGEKPYGVAVLHGGPGAMGSVEDVARHLAKWGWGAMEPLAEPADGDGAGGGAP